MGEIETSNRQITLYYGDKTEKAKKILATAQAQGLPVVEVDLQKTKLTGTQIIELANRLNLRVEDLINQEHPSYMAHFDQHDFSAEDWVKMIQNNPDLLIHPIAIRGDRTILVKTSTDVLSL